MYTLEAQRLDLQTNPDVCVQVSVPTFEHLAGSLAEVECNTPGIVRKRAPLCCAPEVWSKINTRLWPDVDRLVPGRDRKLQESPSAPPPQACSFHAR